MSSRNFSRRFFVQPEESGKIEQESVIIDGPSAHHMINVIRVSVGDEVMLFDGSGHEYSAVVIEVKKSKLTASITGCEAVDRELPFELRVAVALPKGDRQKVLVEKLVELGVTHLIPLNAKRSVVKSEPKSAGKLMRRVIEVSKQCGRNKLMQIEPPLTTGKLFETTDGQLGQPGKRIIAHPYEAADGKTKTAIQVASQMQPTDPVTIAIGPEGGFDLAEVEQAISQDWQPVRIGPTILRVETAAVALATMFGVARTQ